MRLLHTTKFTLRSFFDDSIPEYVILSHTWGEEEVSFQDIQDLHSASRLAGFSKIQKCCNQAAQDEFEWAWIDTCCIDKTSSAELSEAINSMFRWYQNARTCYAYLEDVECECDVVCDEFARSRWFTRGWTLQELIAPDTVEFYSKDWVDLGTKRSLKAGIEVITGIDVGVLEGESLEKRNVALKMSWAANRETTRAEDSAYSLLGLFDVNMPMLYGEGGTKAFIRLQQEIMKTTNDYTLFASRLRFYGGEGLLSDQVGSFRCPENEPDFYSDLEVNPRIEYNYLGMPGDDYQTLTSQIINDPTESSPIVTNKGLRISLAIREEVTHPGQRRRFLAYLNCRRQKDKYLLCIWLCKPWPDKPYHYTKTAGRGSDVGMLVFVAPDPSRTFSHTPMYVERFKDHYSKWWEDRCLFNVHVKSNGLHLVSIADYSWERGHWDAIEWEVSEKLLKMNTDWEMREIYPETASVVELQMIDTTKVRVFFGGRQCGESQTTRPWCEIHGHQETSIEFPNIEDIFELVSTTEFRSDRARKPLNSGNQVIAAIRNGPRRDDYYTYNVQISIVKSADTPSAKAHTPSHPPTRTTRPDRQSAEERQAPYV